MNQVLSEPEKFEVGDNKEYEVEEIINSAMYGQQTNN